jgi:hypothetical protein
MKGDIAIAGFYLTAEEWQAFDTMSRAQLVALATKRQEPPIVAAVIATGSEPNQAPAPVDAKTD